METAISNLEIELRKANEDIVTASYNSNKEAIVDLSRKIKELPPQIDEHYAKLDKVFQEYELHQKEFSRRLSELTDR